ncbi:polysaccharide biosynthesis/export family protein [Bradyrhizobium sp. CCGUVB23]|uniref:polysaccharide biosynthesis/export family protein n=1 Tax=Bradyrhizobium sp. CCGUVB23 TaxID=2949630 RepID=UPI0020B1AC57|nr:SLBB domain-containing protein [Bradyrhizobium sp. CCGUVB23]MCP3459237.1 thiamine pyrophosphate-binding protein [Bradyrhizobium sp. CCGUVB23]
MDGNISLPLVGTLPASGLPLPEIRAKIGAALKSKIFRQRTADGREVVIVIDADEVTATIAEYRPVYVNGDVSKPGEYPYRPASTVRQLVAMAGGYDIMRIRMNNPYLESADLRSEYGSLWTEFAKGQARMWRIKNELGEGRRSIQCSAWPSRRLPGSHPPRHAGWSGRDTAELNRDAVQEIDTTRAFGGLIKWSTRIDSAAKAPEMMARAFSTALGGTPGPVVVELPWDVLEMEAAQLSARVHGVARAEPSRAAMEQAADLVGKAERRRYLARKSGRCDIHLCAPVAYGRNAMDQASVGDFSRLWV